MWSLFLLSVATLAFEINLTRLFSVAQFYHFAFMIVSIALLGFGASGTFLAIVPAFRKASPKNRLSQLGFATGISMFTAYIVSNWLPFDSFLVAWDHHQIWIFILNYLALAAPFFFSGMALGFMLNVSPKNAGKTYAVNLLGSAGGCLLALIAPAHLGGEGMVTLSIALASLAGLVSSLPKPSSWMLALGTAGLLVMASLDLSARLLAQPVSNFLDLQLSPYKSLSYALQIPDARVIHQQWNAFSRLDVVRSESIHSLPGLSFRYLKPLPQVDGLLIDGDDLSPVLRSETDHPYVSYLPNAAAFHLRPNAHVLILEPRGGLDIMTALELNAAQVTVVEVNPLVVDATPIYQDARVDVYVESDRSYLRRSQSKFDIIVVSLVSSFHPVRSGAYTLAEDYRYTVEAFQEALAHLNENGLLIATRWLQDPPSEDLRLFALGLTALENYQADPGGQIVAYRGYNTATIVLKKRAFSADELSSLRAFLAARAFDLSYAPGIQLQETNQFNILPESKYYRTYSELLQTMPRERFYANYSYDVRPPTDDHPFFGHYFKWDQVPQVLTEFGKSWQPFGGAGYIVVLALLLLAIVLAGVIILLPVAIWKAQHKHRLDTVDLRHLGYFGLLGIAFMAVEIPLLQHFILYLGQPAYAVTAVLFALLFFSGLGSQWNKRISLRLALAILVSLVFLLPVILPWLFALSIGLPLPVKLALTALSLSPLGFLMGIPFPAGLHLLTTSPAGIPFTAQNVNIPWIWAVNGAASVIASILSALLALTFGFRLVLYFGALCYAGAMLTVWALPGAARRPDR